MHLYIWLQSFLGRLYTPYTAYSVLFYNTRLASNSVQVSINLFFFYIRWNKEHYLHLSFFLSSTLYNIQAIHSLYIKPNTASRSAHWPGYTHREPHFMNTNLTTHRVTVLIDTNPFHNSTSSNTENYFMKLYYTYSTLLLHWQKCTSFLKADNRLKKCIYFEHTATLIHFKTIT